MLELEPPQTNLVEKHKGTYHNFPSSYRGRQHTAPAPVFRAGMIPVTTFRKAILRQATQSCTSFNHIAPKPALRKSILIPSTQPTLPVWFYIPHDQTPPHARVVGKQRHRDKSLTLSNFTYYTAKAVTLHHKKEDRQDYTHEV